MRVNSMNDLEGLKTVGKVVALTLKRMIRNVQPGITTKELDMIGEKVISRYGARSAPKLVYNFPGITCISVNNEVAHGIPSERILKEGDLVNIDVSAELNGYFADTGATVAVGKASSLTLSLCNCSKTALNKAIALARARIKVNEIGRVIQREAEAQGFNVIKNAGGHGIGRKLHEKPRKISNYYSPLNKTILQEGMVIALETFISTGDCYLRKAKDGWTLKTKNNGLVAQYEHTILIGRDEPTILTEI